MNIKEFDLRIRKGEKIEDILKSTDELTLSNRAFMKHAMLEWRGSFQYASDELKKDKSFVLEFLNSNCDHFPLEYAAPEIRNDRELMLQIAKIDPESLIRADSSLLNDKEFIKKVVEISPIPFAYSNLNSDREFVKEIIKIDGMALIATPYNLGYRKDRELVMEAVKNNPRVINWIDITRRNREFLEDEELLIEACKGFVLGKARGYLDFYNVLSEEMQKKLDETEEMIELQNRKRQGLKSKEEELSSLEAEAKTISEAEALIGQQKEGQDIGEE